MAKGKKSTFRARPGAQKAPQPGKNDLRAATGKIKRNFPLGDS